MEITMRLCLKFTWTTNSLVFSLYFSNFITAVSWIYLLCTFITSSVFFKCFHRCFYLQELHWKWTVHYSSPCILTLAWLSVVKISSWPRWWMKSVWLEQCKCLLSINHLLLLSPKMGRSYFWSSDFICKGGSVEETLIYNSQQTAKFEFSFPVTLCLSFCELFLSHWESAEPVFCSEELSFLPYKKQNKSPIFFSGQENSNFAVC